MSTAHVCPGCNKHKHFSLKAGICDECATLLADAWRLRNQYLSKEQGRYRVWGWYNLECKHDSHELGTLVMQMCRAAGTTVPQAHWYDDKDVEGITDRNPEAAGTRAMILPVALVAAARELIDRMEAALDDEYARGYRDGTNMLTRLANGEASVRDFEEEGLRAGGPRKNRKGKET